jgi:hypothetical protein
MWKDAAVWDAGFLLDDYSVMMWSDKLWLVFCPECRVMHEFTPAATECK